MTRQTWQMVIGASLCLGLLPGCAHSVFSIFHKDPPPHENRDVKFEADRRTGPTGLGRLKDNELPGDNNPQSPYHVNNPNLPAKSFQNANVKIEPLENCPDAQPLEVSAPAETQKQPSSQDHIGIQLTNPAQQPQAARSEPEPPLVAALARLLKEDSDALKLLDAYEPDTRDCFQRVLPVLVSLERAKSLAKLPAEEAAQMQEQMEGLVLALRARSELVIDKMYYCEADPDNPSRCRKLPEEHTFLPCVGDRYGELVCIRVDLRNVGLVRKRGFYETRLVTKVEIWDVRGNKKERKYFDNLQARPLRSLDLGGDFFNLCSFYMPPGIPPGRYQLVLKVRDESSNPPRLTESKPLTLVVADSVVENR